MEAPEKAVLDEAASLISGARNAGYGPAEEDFPRVAIMFNEWLGAKYGSMKQFDFDGEDVGMMMVFLKIRRQAHKRKRDNIVDACGYLALTERVNEFTG